VDDASLLLAWRAGDALAGRKLVERHFEAAYRFFLNKAPHHCEDLVQETFLAVVEARDRIEGQNGFRLYLFGVARRRLYRFWRDRRGDRAEDESVDELGDRAGSAADALAKHQEQKLLLKALRRLPLRTQVLLELSYFEGLTDRQLAEVEGIPVGTLKSRLRKARQDLGGAMAGVDSGEILASTTKNFDDWVASLRRGLAPRNGPNAE
jgi:RNA polymerase sigma-70 factor (ECF subfamily)